MIQRRITIGDKKYTLTANRSIMKTLAKISPDLLKIKDGKMTKEREAEFGIDLYAGLDILFHDMIKVVHKDITPEKSSEILDKFENEYEDVQTALIDLAMSVFTTGDQTKKKITWED